MLNSYYEIPLLAVLQKPAREEMQNSSKCKWIICLKTPTHKSSKGGEIVQILV